MVLSVCHSEAEFDAELIGVLSFGLSLILEEKYKKEAKQMLKELILGVPHPSNIFGVLNEDTKNPILISYT
jgi:hypothetical protein